MRRMSILLAGTCSLSAALAFAAAMLIMASFFLADPVPSGGTVIWIHVFISSLFLVLGLLQAGIAWHSAGIARTLTGYGGETGSRLVFHLSRMIILLLVAEAGLLCVLTIVMSGILSRIGEGFAVFG